MSGAGRRGGRTAATQASAGPSRAGDQAEGDAQMHDAGQAVVGSPAGSYGALAAEFIAEASRVAGLGLRALPEDPAAAAAMRAAGYEVLAGCTTVAGGAAAVWVMGVGEGVEERVEAAELAAALGVAPQALPGIEFVAVLRETPADGRTLSGFRPAA
jgi:hypothetical protein